jgi:tetratricopeptide (TPR) repeat protein
MDKKEASAQLKLATKLFREGETLRAGKKEKSQEKFQEALAITLKTIEASPNFIEGYELAIQIFLRLGDRKSFLHYQKAYQFLKSGGRFPEPEPVVKPSEPLLMPEFEYLEEIREEIKPKNKKEIQKESTVAYPPKILTLPKLFSHPISDMPFFKKAPLLFQNPKVVGENVPIPLKFFSKSYGKNKVIAAQRERPKLFQNVIPKKIVLRILKVSVPRKSRIKAFLHIEKPFVLKLRFSFLSPTLQIATCTSPIKMKALLLPKIQSQQLTLKMPSKTTLLTKTKILLKEEKRISIRKMPVAWAPFLLAIKKETKPFAPSFSPLLHLKLPFKMHLRSYKLLPSKGVAFPFRLIKKQSSVKTTAIVGIQKVVLKHSIKLPVVPLPLFWQRPARKPLPFFTKAHVLPMVVAASKLQGILKTASPLSVGIRRTIWHVPPPSFRLLRTRKPILRFSLPSKPVASNPFALWLRKKTISTKPTLLDYIEKKALHPNADKALSHPCNNFSAPLAIKTLALPFSIAWRKGKPKANTKAIGLLFSPHPQKKIPIQMQTVPFLRKPKIDFLQESPKVLSRTILDRIEKGEHPLLVYAAELENEGDKLMQQGKKEEAGAAYSEAGAAFIEAGEVQKAAEMFEKALKGLPGNIEILKRLDRLETQGAVLGNEVKLEIYRKVYGYGSKF